MKRAEELAQLWHAELQIQDLLQDQGKLTPETVALFRKHFQAIEDEFKRFFENESENQLNQSPHMQPALQNPDSCPTNQNSGNRADSALSLPVSKRHKRKWTKPAIGLYHIFSAFFPFPLDFFPKKGKSNHGSSYSLRSTARKKTWNKSSKRRHLPHLHLEMASLFQKKNVETLAYIDRCSSSTSITVTADNVSPDDEK